MKFCKLADIVDFQEPEFQATAALLLETAPNRKSWEFVQVYQGLKQLGLLHGQSKALGLGVGSEHLIYAFTNVCEHVTATDLYESQKWSTAAMTTSDIYRLSPFAYQPERLSVQHMDMTQIKYPDGHFDFVWSCCAIEHVQNFQALHQVYQEIHRVLKPGGIAALTTEFNNSNHPSYEPHLLFTDRCWIEQWLTGADPLIQGFELLDSPDLNISDRSENQPTFRRVAGSSIQIYCNDIVLNSVSIFLRKSGEFSRSYDAQWLPEFWRNYHAAYDAYRAAEFDRAEQLLKQILQADLEPRLRMRARRRLADTLQAQAKLLQAPSATPKSDPLAQAKLAEMRQVCLSALPDCALFQDSDQIIPLAMHCMQAKLYAEANSLLALVETLPGANLESIIRSKLQQAKCYQQQGQFEAALEAVSRAKLLVVPGDYIEQRFQAKIQFQAGLAYEKLGDLEAAVQAYRLAVSSARPEFQTLCYRRLTACLQQQINQMRQRAEQAEVKLGTSQQFWPLRPALAGLKQRLRQAATKP